MRSLFVVGSLICVALTFGAGLAIATDTGQTGAKVDFTACPVHLGIEGGCWTAKSPDGVIYELGAAATTPKAGLLVHVVGTVWNGVSICNVGRPLKPVTVTILRTPCRVRATGGR